MNSRAIFIKLLRHLINNHLGTERVFYEIKKQNQSSVSFSSKADFGWISWALSDIDGGTECVEPIYEAFEFFHNGAN
jgi:hypothetical protein